MRKSLIALAVLAGAFLLSGCESLLSGHVPVGILEKAVEAGDKVDNATLGNLAKGIDKYCEKVPVLARGELRHRINKHTVNGDIYIDCADDPPLTIDVN